MPLESKPNILSRVFSRFSIRRNKPAAAQARDRLEGSSTVAAGPSPSSHPQPPTLQSRSANEIALSQSDPISMHHYGQHDSPRPPQTFLMLQPCDSPPAVHGVAPSFFQGASGFRMRDFHVNVNSAGDKSIDGWELLSKNIAPNALHDSRARYDAPKCDEDTRVEVIGEIMEWIQDRDAPQHLLCVTGAAGSGKSALQQTIAEHCSKSGILSATFFFSSADPTRNTISLIVPTIAYQMGLKHNAFRSSVAAAVEHDPHIFSRSLHSQMDALVVHPFESLQKAKQLEIDTFPHAILIDGLDECKGEPNVIADPTRVDADNRRRAEDQQAELLAAIKHCILNTELSFRVLVASRPEWAIRTALEPGGHLLKVAYHIQLSDQYDASADMRRYLQRRFEDIGLRIGDSKWFNEGDIETLVRAASGQFIYVATVYKYISERRASPSERLKIVLIWTPHVGQRARPFEALDVLYTNILLAAKNAYEAIDSHHERDFLLLFRAHHINIRGFQLYGIRWCQSADFFSMHSLGLEARAEESLISDLRSLVVLGTRLDIPDFIVLRLYHKSFSDFLEEESRAKDLFVPEARIRTYLAKCFMQRIIEWRLDIDSMPDRWEELPLPKSPWDSSRAVIERLAFSLSTAASALDHEVADFTQKGGWEKIDKLLPLAYHAGRSVAIGKNGLATSVDSVTT